jgi:hypothetical protein
MIEIHGLGAIITGHTADDYPISQAYAALGIEPAAVIPTTYRVPPEQLQPVMNQATTPRCVAFAEAGLKGWEDRQDQAQFFAWDTGLFFSRIGGGANGAVVRVGFDQMLKVGYPVVSIDDAAHHRIASYYAAGLSQAAVQQAVLDFGPIVLGMTWLGSMDRPAANGVLTCDPKSGVRGGHAIQCVGWTLINGVLYFILRNSWGTGWGLAGEAYLPASSFAYLVGEAWKAVDVIDPAPVPPSPSPVVLKYGGYAGYRGDWRVSGAYGANVRLAPNLSAKVVQVVPTGYAFHNEQTTDQGSLWAGSRRWLGDATGNRWIHRSLCTLVK